MRNNSILQGSAIFEKYIRKNFLKYSLILIIYLIGFTIGISTFNNNLDNNLNIEEISQYIIESMEGITTQTSDAISNYIKQDFFELIVICLLSFSIIGIPAILILLFVKAISLGITISALIYSSGIGYGLSFSILVYMIPTIVKIIVLLIIVCSSLKFIENILKYKKETKYEMIRHAFAILIAFSAICLIALYRVFSLNIINQILI